MTFVLQPEHNQATAVITVFKCFFTVRTIDDDVTDAVVCKSMHTNRIQYRQFRPQNENCERCFYTISGAFYSSWGHFAFLKWRAKKVLCSFAYKMVWYKMVLDMMKNWVDVNFPAESLIFSDNSLFHLRESNSEKSSPAVWSSREIENFISDSDSWHLTGEVQPNSDVNFSELD